MSVTRQVPNQEQLLLVPDRRLLPQRARSTPARRNRVKATTLRCGRRRARTHLILVFVFTRPGQPKSCLSPLQHGGAARRVADRDQHDAGRRVACQRDRHGSFWEEFADMTRRCGKEKRSASAGTRKSTSASDGIPCGTSFEFVVISSSRSGLIYCRKGTHQRFRNCPVRFGTTRVVSCKR